MANPFDEFDQQTNPFNEFDALEAPATPVAVDVAGQLATGIVKGIPNILDLGGAAVATAADAAMGRSGEGGAMQNFQQYLQSAPVSRGVDTLLGTQERPAETTAGRYANLTGQGISTAPMVGARLAQGAAGGFLGGVGGDIGKASGVPMGEVLGSFAGGMAGAAAVGPLTQRAKAVTQRLTAPKIDQGTAQLAQRAQQFDIPLSVTQVAPTRVRSTVQKVSQELPFSGVGKFEDTQVSAWNKALTKTIGVEADTLSPEIVNQFLQKTGKEYDNVLAGTTVRMGKDASRAIQGAVDESYKTMDKSLADIVAANAQDLLAQAKGGFISGEKAASIRRTLMNRASKASGEVKDALGDIVSQFDEVIRQSMPQEKVDALNTLNRQYRNFKTIEPLLEKSADGVINPTQLLQRVASSKFIKGSRAELGQDDLVDLARIGKMMPRLGGSDTAQKTTLMQAVAPTSIAGTAVEPTTGITALAGNRAYQSLYNQNQAVVNAAIERAARKAAFEAKKGGSIKDAAKKAYDTVAKELASPEGQRGSLRIGQQADDLPLDTASRMQRAREMGFDVDNPVYHGTGADINEFMPSTGGKMGAGVYMSDNPVYASAYGQGTGGNVIKSAVRGKIAGGQEASIASEKARVMLQSDPSTKDLPSRQFNILWKETRNKMLQEEGFDGLKLSDETVVFDPKNIRSVNAKFDPAKKDSANLLAARPEATLAAVGLTGYALTPKEEKKRRKAEFEARKTLGKKE